MNAPNTPLQVVRVAPCHGLLITTGDHLDMAQPEAAPLEIFDIAWALSQINRYLGRTLRPYSVAEHSLLVVEILEREFGWTEHHQSLGLLAALMDEAHKAFTGDMPRPCVGLLQPRWAWWVGAWRGRISSLYGLQAAQQLVRTELAMARMIARATERAHLLPTTQVQWADLAAHDAQPAPWANLRSAERTQAGWEDWRDRWLDRFHCLAWACGELGVPIHQGGHVPGAPHPLDTRDTPPHRPAEAAR